MRGDRTALFGRGGGETPRRASFDRVAPDGGWPACGCKPLDPCSRGGVAATGRDEHPPDEKGVNCAFVPGTSLQTLVIPAVMWLTLFVTVPFHF